MTPLSTILRRLADDPNIAPRFRAAVKQAIGDRPVLNPCPHCGGGGEIETGAREINRRDGSLMVEIVRCEHCNGTGSIEEPAELIDEADLDEMDAEVLDDAATAMIDGAARDAIEEGRSTR